MPVAQQGRAVRALLRAAVALVVAIAPALAGCGALFARPEAERDRAHPDAFLLASPAPLLLVEVDWLAGRAPALVALEGLRARLAAVTGRAVAIRLGPHEKPASPFLPTLHVRYEALSPRGLRGLCAGRDLWVYRDQVASHAILWIGADTLERTVLVHEAGHALGLGHCTRPDCVMYKPREGEVWDWRMVFANLGAAVFCGEVPDDFCPLCAADLAGPRD